MKNLLIGIALASATLLSATAFADVYVTPKVGYNFQTDRTLEQQAETVGEGIKNNGLYGVSVGTDLTATTKIEAEYLYTNSNIEAEQAGININKELGKNVYFVGGAGYYKLLGTKDTIESPYVKAGVGIKKQLTNMLAVKGEASGLYVTEHDQWTPQALVGLEINLNEISKPYSK